MIRGLRLAEFESMMHGTEQYDPLGQNASSGVWCRSYDKVTMGVIVPCFFMLFKLFDWKPIV